jgi:hypothetical protein
MEVLEVPQAVSVVHERNPLVLEVPQAVSVVHERNPLAEDLPPILTLHADLE